MTESKHLQDIILGEAPYWGNINCNFNLSGNKGENFLIGSKKKYDVKSRESILHKRRKTAGKKIQRNNICFK